MRLSVTPIGSARLSAGQIASAVVEYLAGVEEQPPALTGQPAPSANDAAAGYYADSVEGPGRWIGRGAARLGLSGLVDRDAFARVLEGRDPSTGARLLTARGSAERDHLAVGQPTRRADDGEWLYDVRDAAKALGLTAEEVEGLIRRGDTSSVGPALVAEGDDEGGRWIRDGELERFAAAAPTAESVAGTGAPTDQLDTAEAAALLGVSVQYVRSCCRYWETHRRHIEALVAAELRPGRAWMVCSRVGDGRGGRYVIERQDVAAFAARRTAPVVRVGYDLTLSTEKSVAVAALLDVGGRSRQVLDAIDGANDVAVGYLDRYASHARRRGGRVGSEGLVVASFLHGTSRALDPFPHRHNVVANAVVDDTGDRRALDARELYRHAPAAAALATAELRWRLTRDLGVRWRRSPRGVWEIDGIPDSTIREFSQRRDEIDAALAELGEAMGRPLAPADVDNVVLATRAAKARVPVEELRAGWWERASRSGLDRRAFARCFANDGATVVDRLTDEQEDRLHAWLCEHIVEEHAVFAHGDVVRAICEWTDDSETLVVIPPREVLRQAARLLASDRVVELRGAGAARHALQRRDGRTVDMSGGDPAFATVALLELERSIIDAFDAGAHASAAVVPADALDATLADAALTPDQERFARTLCTSGMAIQCAVGRPGSGKTHTLGVAARAWTEAGMRVVGAAVKGEAARLLADATSVPTETVAWWLTSLRCGRTRWDDRTVVLVDEASTIGTEDLAELASAAARSGAAVRLVGDPHQHGAVGAGGMFASLARRQGNVPELEENRRQITKVDRFAAAAVRAGRVGEALAALKRAGQLTEVDRPEGVYAAMLTRWLAAREAGEPHPMIDRQNGTRRVLNALAHRVLQDTGEVAPTGLITADGLEFCIGDEVVARRPDRSLHPLGNRDLYVRNGSRGRVVAVHKDCDPGVTVAFDNLGKIRLPLSFIERGVDDRGRSQIGLDYGYALTSYAVQGATLPVSSSAITAGGRRRELYVNITRGRRDNHVFVAAPADPAAGEGHLPRPPEGDVVAEVLAAVGRPDEQRCAHDLDPYALAAARLRRDRSLPELSALAAADEIAARAAELEAGAIARLALAEPADWLVDALPPRPSVPWLADRWDTAAGQMAVAAARVGTDDPSSIDGPDDAVAARVDAWSDYLRRALSELATSTRRPSSFLAEPFAADAIAAAASRARPQDVDVGELFSLLADTAAYLAHVGVTAGGSADVLGACPSNRRDRREWSTLARRWSLHRHEDAQHQSPARSA